MYLQLTERCNMRCGHCCMNATTKGEDMSWDVFLDAIELCDEYLTLGGGEPTLWIHFKDMIDYFDEKLWYNNYIYNILMITNGTKYRNIFKYINLMEKFNEFTTDEKLSIYLSYNDGYHDDSKIHPKILNYFLHKKDNFRTVNTIYKVGRGKDIGTESGCGCSDCIVKPNGTIRWCLCENAPVIGTVRNGIVNNDYNGMCYSDYLKGD